MFENNATGASPAEVWKPLVGFEGYYEVSDLGRIRCLPRQVTRVGRCKKPFTVTWKGGVINGRSDKDGYVEVSLSVNGQRYNRKLHRLICETFHGAPTPERYQTGHWDGCKTNNAAANLRWVSAVENFADSVRLGTTWFAKSARK